MSSREDDVNAHTERELFRRTAIELGFGSEELDFEAAQIETADQFIARMKQRDIEAQTSGSFGSTKPLGKRSKSQRVRRLVGVASALAATAALVMVIGRPGGSPAAAAAPPVLDFEFASAVRIAYAPGQDPTKDLDLLADAAATNVVEPSHGGRIQYKKSYNWYVDLDDRGSSKIVPRVSETWLLPNGSLTTHESVGRPLRSDGRGVLADGGRRVINETIPAGSLDADFARSLPTEPGQLAQSLLEHSECESRTRSAARSMCLYREIVGLAQTYVISDQLAKAIWSMLRTEVGFRTLGSVEDRAGRDAVGISIIDPEEPHVRHLILGSLGGGQIVGSEEILIQRDAGLDIKPPSVLSFSTVIEYRLTSTLPG